MKLITKLTIFTVSIVLLPMIFTYELNRRFSVSEIESQYNTNLDLALQGFETELDNYKEKLFQRAIQFSKLPRFRELSLNSPEVQQSAFEMFGNSEVDLFQITDTNGASIIKITEWGSQTAIAQPAKLPNIENKAYLEADSDSNCVYLKSSAPIYRKQQKIGFLTIGKRINRSFVWQVSHFLNHETYIFYNHRFLTGSNQAFNLPHDFASLEIPVQSEPLHLKHYKINGLPHNIALKPIVEKSVLLGYLGVSYPLSKIQNTLAKRSTNLILIYGYGLIVGLGGAVFLVRNIKSSLHGMEPKEIANLLCERTALLQSIHEGLIAVDRFSRITLYNQEAQKLFQLDDSLVGQPLTRIFPSGHPIITAVKERKTLYNEQLRHRQISLIYNLIPVYHQRHYLGAIATFNNLTDFYTLAEELTAVKTYTEALRAQAHEFKNRLHTISGLIQINSLDEALQLIHQTFSVQQKLIQFIMKAFPTPQISGLLIGKINHAWELGVKVKITDDSRLDPITDKLYIAKLVCILGNLLENSLEAVRNSATKQVVLKIKPTNRFILIKILDFGVGIPPNLIPVIFQKGFTTKKDPNHGMGLYLIQESIKALNGSINVFSRPDRFTLFSLKIPVEDLTCLNTPSPWSKTTRPF